MAKCRLTAGAELDIPTAAEIRTMLREWQVDTAKGLRPISFSARGDVTAGGVLTMGGSTTLTGGRLGPEPAFWWAVSRLAVRVNDVPIGAFAVGLVSGHVRDVPASANGYANFAAQELLVGNADTLTITATGATASGIVTVTGAAVEIPQGLLWRWLAG